MGAGNNLIRSTFPLLASRESNMAGVFRSLFIHLSFQNVRGFRFLQRRISLMEHLTWSWVAWRGYVRHLTNMTCLFAFWRHQLRIQDGKGMYGYMVNGYSRT